MTLLPAHHLPKVSLWEILTFETFAHSFVFAILCFLLIVGFTKQFSYPKLRMYAVRVAIITSSVFGLLIEILQELLQNGREGDIIDVLANIIGTAVGYLIFYLIYKV